MGSAAYVALFGSLFSATLRALYSGSVGISVFLLVPVRLGNRRVSAVGDRISEAEELDRSPLSRQLAGYYLCCPAAVKSRCNAPSAYQRVALKVGCRAGLSCVDAGGYREALGVAADAVVGRSVMFDISLISTRRFLARPEAVLSLATC